MAVDVDKFRWELVYRTQAPCTQVLGDLEVLRKLDARNEKLESPTNKVGCGTLFAAVAIFILAINIDQRESPTLHEVALGGSVLLVVAGIIAFVLRSQHKRLNLENRRHELATRLVRMLQADTALTEPLTVEIDLRPGTHADKLIGERKTRSGWNEKSYADRWLSVQGRLLDGTHLRLEMTERIDERSRTKRSSSGKYKTKRKTLSDAFVRVRLRVKPEKYQHLGRLKTRARDAVRLPSGTRLESLTVEEDRLDMTVLANEAWGVDRDPTPVNATQVVAMTLLSLYQLLNLSRAIDKKASNA